MREIFHPAPTEFKVSERQDKRLHRGFQRMQSALGKRMVDCYGVYLGERSTLRDGVQILPVDDVLK